MFWNLTEFRRKKFNLKIDIDFLLFPASSCILILRVSFAKQTWDHVSMLTKIA